MCRSQKGVDLLQRVRQSYMTSQNLLHFSKSFRREFRIIPLHAPEAFSQLLKLVAAQSRQTDDENSERDPGACGDDNRHEIAED